MFVVQESNITTEQYCQLPPQMLAAQYKENTDDLSALRLERVEKSALKEGYVRVRIHTAAINPIDRLVMKGFAHKVLGWDMPLPFTMGYDFAGAVDAVDGAVNDFSAGDRVFGVNWGTHKHVDPGFPAGGAFAEYISIPASKLSKLPANVSFDEGAAVALVGTTAYQITFDCAKVSAGQKVLILGGSTSVGSIAIQLAKAKGAWVAATCSTRNVSYVQSLGVDLVVYYTEQKWEEHSELRNLKALLDCVGEQQGWARNTANGVVKADGAFVSIVGTSDVGFNPAGHPPMQFASVYTLKNSAAVQDELASMIAAGTLKVVIDDSFPFTKEGVDALIKKCDSGSSVGKNILRIMQ
jgi:NADPH:quinone reductase-like Zn-dependent oxidoreductase